jgi:hypothetical protein
MTSKIIDLITGSVVILAAEPRLPAPTKLPALECVVTDVFQRRQEAQPCASDPRTIAHRVATILCNIYFDIETPETLLMRLLHSPHARQLFEQVRESRKKEGLPGVTIRLITPEEAAKHPITFQGGAHVCPESGVITIASHLPRKDRLACLLFELANLSNAERFSSARKDMCEKLTSPLEYAWKTERIEFDSNTLANKITLLSVENSFWEKEMLSTLSHYDSYAHYLSHVKGSLHFQRYVDQAKRLQNG